jgi:branched-subunit amino acid permease
LSQQTPYPPQPGYDPQPGFPAGGYQPQKTNTMAILGLIFAFVFSPLGIVFSAVGLSQIKKRREGGRGLAIAGLVLSIVFVLVGIALFAFVIAVADEVADQTTVSAAPLDSPAENLEGVAAACEVIMPAMANLETDMAAVTTPEEYTAVITELRGTMESAAAASAEEMFIADVQLLSDDLQEASDVVAAGEDPTYLESALAEDSDQVAATCDLAGWTE